MWRCRCLRWQYFDHSRQTRRTLCTILRFRRPLPWMDAWELARVRCVHVGFSSTAYRLNRVPHTTDGSESYSRSAPLCWALTVRRQCQRGVAPPGACRAYSQRSRGPLASRVTGVKQPPVIYSLECRTWSCAVHLASSIVSPDQSQQFWRAYPCLAVNLTSICPDAWCCASASITDHPLPAAEWRTLLLRWMDASFAGSYNDAVHHYRPVPKSNTHNWRPEKTYTAATQKDASSGNEFPLLV